MAVTDTQVTEQNQSIEDDPNIVDLHPDHLEGMRDVLLHLFETANPLILKQLPPILISHPFVIQKYQDLMITLLEHPHLFSKQYYANLGRRILTLESYFYILNKDDGFAEVELSPFGFRVYEILDRVNLDIGEINSYLTPNTIARWCITRLCAKFMETFQLPENTINEFEIYLYQKVYRPLGLKLYYCTKIPSVTEKVIQKLIKKIRSVHEDLNSKGLFQGVDRSNQQYN